MHLFLLQRMNIALKILMKTFPYLSFSKLVYKLIGYKCAIATCIGAKVIIDAEFSLGSKHH